MKSVISVLLLVCSMFVFTTASAVPPLWEATYQGTELNGAAGGATGAVGPSEAIDGEESIALGFNFPFAGINYTHISVDDDGAIVLMNADAVTP
ncbi:MAG: hypothetical protein GY785_05520, partial [Gammaproteobacteria bacterium]|nr:hypothetical protein [Gammaproteobacteria bacterium]